MTSHAGTGAHQPRPVNAPPARELSIGVQPGVPNVIRAKLVIVTAGPQFSGIFIYDPVPGFGNLIASMSDPGATGFGTDPYGNVYIQGIFDYKDVGGGLIEAIGLQNGTLQFYSAATEAGPWTQQWQIGAGATPQVMSLLTSNAGGNILLGGAAAGSRVLVQGTAADLLTVQGDVLSTGQVFTQDPAAPGTDEVLHSVSATVGFANGWLDGGAPRAPLKYRLVPSPANEIEWAGSLKVPVGFAAGQAVTAALPAAYRPANSQSRPYTNTTNNLMVRVNYSPGGVFTFGGPVANVAAGDILDGGFGIPLAA